MLECFLPSLHDCRGHIAFAQRCERIARRRLTSPQFLETGARLLELLRRVDVQPRRACTARPDDLVETSQRFGILLRFEAVGARKEAVGCELKQIADSILEQAAALPGRAGEGHADEQRVELESKDILDSGAEAGARQLRLLAPVLHLLFTVLRTPGTEHAMVHGLP